MLHEHIDQLCDELMIRRVLTDNTTEALPERQLIRHPPVTDEMGYFVALHQIGLCMEDPLETEIETQAAAWRWALDHTIRAPHFSTRQRITALLVQALYATERDGKAIPEDGDFWRLIKWWEEAPGDRVWKKNWGVFRVKRRKQNTSEQPPAL